MATRYAVATGNWSSIATWDGGTLPQPGDDVYANGFTITVDVTTIDVNFITTNVNPVTLIGGGGFTITTANDYYFLCDIIAGSSNCLFYSGVNIKVYVYGDVSGGSSGIGLYATNTSANPASTTPEIVGNVYGGSGAGSYGITGNPSRAINPIVTGNVYGGTGAAGILSATAYIASINVTGNVYGGSGVAGISMSGVLTIDGTITANISGIEAILFGTTGSKKMIIDGYIINVGTTIAFRNVTYLEMPTSGSLEWVIQNDTPSDVTLRTPIAGGNYPNVGDVRTGTNYGSVNEFTGTCDVPSPSSVAVGVPIDNTIGTAMINISDMGALLSSYVV
jgi:hypothetical protein